MSFFNSNYFCSLDFKYLVTLGSTIVAVLESEDVVIVGSKHVSPTLTDTPLAVHRMRNL